MATLTYSQISRCYLEEQVNTMSPVQLVVKMYDVGLASCEQKNSQRLSSVLVELISALNFDQREVALGLFRLYQFCLTRSKAGDFEAVKPILRELRDAWDQAARIQPQLVAQPA